MRAALLRDPLLKSRVLASVAVIGAQLDRKPAGAANQREHFAPGHAEHFRWIARRRDDPIFELAPQDD